METPDITTSVNINGKSKSYQIEHLPNFDVVLNLDYPHQEDRDIILDILKTDPSRFESKIDSQSISSENNTSRFYLKWKRGSGKPSADLDFLLGRSKVDPLSKRSKDFSRRVRYTLIGASNEIVLSKKIKELISLNEVQSLAKTYGFTKITFSEPIMAITEKDSHNKYLIYRRIHGYETRTLEDYEYEVFEELALKLKELFLSHGIIANDLWGSQFIVTNQGHEKYLTLIDIEAYTEEKSSES